MKLYPFSSKRHSHDIELCRNYMFNRGLRDHPFYKKIEKVREYMFGDRVVYLPGELIDVAKQCVNMAVEIRDNANHRKINNYYKGMSKK